MQRNGTNCPSMSLRWAGQEKYPDHCKSAWTEPKYTEGACYDVIWQFVLYRDHADEKWQAKGFSHLHMGFAGQGSSCKEAFEPFSNPTSWLAKTGTVGTDGAFLSAVLGFCSILLMLLGRFHLPSPVQRGKEPLLDRSPVSENYITVF